MARAKQTGRAEARRRHRQTIAETRSVPEGSDASTADRGTTAQRIPSGSSAAPTGRIGFFDSFRKAYRPVHLREDLAYLPQILRSTAFVVGLAIIFIGTAALLVAPSAGAVIFAFTVADANGFPAISPMLVAGYLAPRGGYLIGFLLGIFQALAVAAVARRFDVLLLVLPLSVSIGLLCGAAGAWYKRSLAFMAATRPGQRPASRSNRQSGRGQRR